jgi:lycopene cyclase domain-containing protein
MPYLLIITLFLVLPIGVVFIRLRGRASTRYYLALGATSALMLAYVGLWANFAAARGAVHYAQNAGDQSAALILGMLPLEQMGFFLFQVLLVGGTVLVVWRRLYPSDFE